MRLTLIALAFAAGCLNDDQATSMSKGWARGLGYNVQAVSCVCNGSMTCACTVRVKEVAYPIALSCSSSIDSCMQTGGH